MKTGDSKWFSAGFPRTFSPDAPDPEALLWSGS
jgi:hypothetical protein